MRPRNCTLRNLRPLTLLAVVALTSNITFADEPIDISGSATHVTVRRETGRCYGWPANHGAWAWGNEILVQYKSGTFNDKPSGSHDIDYNKPIIIEESRSLDGGLTWSEHSKPAISVTEPGWGQEIKNASALKSPINFTDPDTIVTFTWAGSLHFSNDRGRTWHGPYSLPKFDMVSWQLRTDYVVEDNDSLLAFWSGSKANFKREENGGMVYMVRTDNGGQSWNLVSRISRFTEPSEKKHDVALMPATVRIDENTLVCCIRNLSAYPKRGWIDCRVSKDNGLSWKLVSTPVGNEAGTTPPALTMLDDGRLVLTYGYRKPIKGPTSIRGRISKDAGQTWGDELILRTGGGDEDVGYTRNALRPDGKIVTMYYWQEDESTEREIAATIWNP